MMERERAAEELVYLGEENERLMDRHTHHAQLMQEEAISLPTDMDELHHILLQYREEVIRTRVGREHLEESLQSEIRFLKDQSVSEQEEKKGIIEMLSRDNGKQIDLFGWDYFFVMQNKILVLIVLRCLKGKT